ncbi:MAG TPA: hypothetical protein VMT22_26030 [Terriglobales bacterium]|jgi:adenylate kinase family enzyme|nr:hypothetical protein [Terriglobales bacterium]
MIESASRADFAGSEHSLQLRKLYKCQTLGRPIKKVAVFGNAGGGKSTRSKRLSEITGLPLYVLDKIKYRSGGIEVLQEGYKRTHEKILLTDRWIIDGFGCMETLWQRLDKADSLIFMDMPLYLHFWWVSKRLITGWVKPPEGWPD